MSLITRTSLGLPVLPPDVQYQIFHFIRQNRNTLKTCTVVCKLWERLLTPDLFNTFNIATWTPSPTDIPGRLLNAPDRVTKSFTILRVQSRHAFPLDTLLSIIAIIPNVHTLDLWNTKLVVSSDGPAFSRPHKFSLRSLSIIRGSMFTYDYSLLMTLLSCFHRVDSLKLVSPNVPPPWLPGAWPSLPEVKNLSVGPMYQLKLPLLLCMAQQPGFSKHLVSLNLDRCARTWESLASVADILRVLKSTIQIFRFFPMYGFGAFRPIARDAAALEQALADGLASCTALREVRFTLHSSPPGGCTGTFRHLSETFDLYCLCIRRIAQNGLPVAVDFKVFLDHNSDPWGFDQAMAKCDWAKLDEAASDLVRQQGGKMALTLRFTRWDRQEEREDSRRMMVARVAAMDWRRYLPRLTNPKDPKVDLSQVQWGPAHWEPFED